MNPAPESTLDLDGQFVMPTYGRFPLCLARGQGSRVWDEEGRAYLDFGAGIAVCSVGHAHPEVAERVHAQFLTLSHTSNLYYTRPQAELAKRLTRMVGIPGRSFFCNSGGEANEALFKLARKFGHGTGGRHEILTALNSFHGRTLAGIAATGQEKVKIGFGPAVEGFRHIPFNDLRAFENAVGPCTAAILIEPIQGEGGIRPATPEFLRGLRDLCDRNNLLLLFDEVQCGLGRTGNWCAWKEIAPEVIPDGISWAKGIAGGFPFGAAWARERKIDGGCLSKILSPGTHATTYGGNPLAATAAIAVLDVLEKGGGLQNARAMGRRLVERITALRNPKIIEVRGMGLLLGIQLAPEVKAEDFGSASQVAPSLAAVLALMRAGLLTIPAGVSVVRLLPPLNVTEAEVDEAVSILAATLA